MANKLQNLKSQLQRLRDDHNNGLISIENYEDQKRKLEKDFLDQLLEVPASNRWPMRIVAAVALVATSATGHAYWVQSTGVQKVTSSQERVGPHGTQPSQVNAMVDKLTKRLNEHPEDASGWAMLGRTYHVLEQHAEALKAYEKSVAIDKTDANVLADYAEAMAFANGNTFGDDSLAWISRALVLDPNNLKALYLAGATAFESKDFPKAVRHWERISRLGSPSDPLVVQIGPSLSRARALASEPKGIGTAISLGKMTTKP